MVEGVGRLALGVALVEEAPLRAHQVPLLVGLQRAMGELGHGQLVGVQDVAGLVEVLGVGAKLVEREVDRGVEGQFPVEAKLDPKKVRKLFNREVDNA